MSTDFMGSGWGDSKDAALERLERARVTEAQVRGTIEQRSWVTRVLGVLGLSDVVKRQDEQLARVLAEREVVDALMLWFARSEKNVREAVRFNARSGDAVRGQLPGLSVDADRPASQASVPSENIVDASMLASARRAYRTPSGVVMVEVSPPTPAGERDRVARFAPVPAEQFNANPDPIYWAQDIARRAKQVVGASVDRSPVHLSEASAPRSGAARAGLIAPQAADGGAMGRLLVRARERQEALAPAELIEMQDGYPAAGM